MRITALCRQAAGREGAGQVCAAGEGEGASKGAAAGAVARAACPGKGGCRCSAAGRR